MRRLTATLCLTLAVLLGSAGEGWSNGANWHDTNCRGNFPERIYDQYLVEGYLFTLINQGRTEHPNWIDPDCFDSHLIVTKPYASRSSGAPETFVPWFLDDPLIVETYPRGVQVLASAPEYYKYSSAKPGDYPGFITDTGTYFIVSWSSGGTASTQITVYTVAPHFQTLAHFSAKSGVKLTNDGIIVNETVVLIDADGDFCFGPSQASQWLLDIKYTFYADRLVARRLSEELSEGEIQRRNEECGPGWRSMNRSDYENHGWGVPLWLAEGGVPN